MNEKTYCEMQKDHVWEARDRLRLAIDDILGMKKHPMNIVTSLERVLNLLPEVQPATGADKNDD